MGTKNKWNARVISNLIVMLITLFGTICMFLSFFF